jgi:hypothetical protein
MMEDGRLARPAGRDARPPFKLSAQESVCFEKNLT